MLRLVGSYVHRRTPVFASLAADGVGLWASRGAIDCEAGSAESYAKCITLRFLG